MLACPVSEWVALLATGGGLRAHFSCQCAARAAKSEHCSTQRARSGGVRPGPTAPPRKPPSSQLSRQDFVAEAGASRKSVGAWELFFGTFELSGERDGGLGLARFLAVCPLDGHMHANGLLWHAGMAGAACMGLTT
jgi:hypothetical protein